MKLLICLLLYIVLLPSLTAQTYTWEWAERGGGKRNISEGSSPAYYRGYEHIRDIVIDSNNNYYYLAQVGNDQSTYGSLPITTYDDDNSERDVYVFSTDAQGNFRFGKTIGGGLWSDFPGSLAIDAQNNIYVSGSAPASVQANDTPVHFDTDSIMPIGSLNTPSPANKSLYTLKYDSGGNFQWLRQPQSPNLSWNDIFPETQHFDMDVAPDGTVHWFCRIGPGSHLNGNLVVPDSMTAGQSVIIRYDTQGNYLSHILLDFELDGFNGFNVSMDYDPVNNRYYLAAHRLTGNSSLSFNGVLATTTFLLALDTSGNLIWREDNVTVVDGTESMLISDVKVDNQGDIFITGKVNSAANGNSGGESFAGYVFDQTLDSGSGTTAAYLLKLNAQGILLWGSNTDTFSFYPGRSISFFGNEVVLGLGLDNNTTWDGFSVGGSGNEASLVHFDKATGAVIEVIKTNSGTANAEITAVAADQLGNYVVGGFTESSLFVNDNTMPTLTKTGGAADFFTAKLACQNCNLSTDNPSASPDMVLYPNPARAQFSIKSQQPLSRYQIFDVQGKNIQHGQLNANPIDISNLENGVYLIKVISQNQHTQVLKLVVE